MILRRLSMHVKDQNWFAVALDFLIVVAGILIAFQITDWNERQQEKANLARAELALKPDIVQNYVYAKERLALSECRINQLNEIGSLLLSDNAAWQPLSDIRSEGDGRALPTPIRSPKRFWSNNLWQIELARGSLDLLEHGRLRTLDRIFSAVSKISDMQNRLGNAEAQLKVLTHSLELSQTERKQLYSALGMIAHHSADIEQLAASIIRRVESLGIVLNTEELAGLAEFIANLDDLSLSIYGDCRKPITTPFLN